MDEDAAEIEREKPEEAYVPEYGYCEGEDCFFCGTRRNHDLAYYLALQNGPVAME